MRRLWRVRHHRGLSLWYCCCCCCCCCCLLSCLGLLSLLCRARVLLVGAHSQISVAVLCLDAKVPIFAMVLFTGCRCLRGVFRPASVRLGRCYRRSGQIRGTLASRLRTARRKWLLQAQLHAQSRESSRVESSRARRQRGMQDAAREDATARDDGGR